MNCLTLYFSKRKTLPAHQPITASDGEIVGYIRVTRQRGRVDLQKALDHAEPEKGEVVLNSVEE